VSRSTPAAIRGFTKDYEHGQVAFELFREATLCSVALGSLMRADQPEWPIREAVLGGHFVRLAKLMRGFLRHTKDVEAELAWITSRMMPSLSRRE
jgi:hypothetical protein